MNSNTQGEGGSESLDGIFDNVDAEMQKQQEPQEDSVPTPNDSETDSTTTEPPSEHSEAEDQKEDNFSDLFPKKEEPKEISREKSLIGQFKSHTNKILENEEDFDNLSPWIKKGVCNTLVEMVEKNEIDLEDIPEDVQERVSKRLSEKKESEKVKLEQTKEESAVNLKIAELKILSKEIPKENFDGYLKSIKTLLQDMPSASMERIHYLAKLENGISHNVEKTRRGIPIHPPKNKPKTTAFNGANNASEISNSDPEEVARWLLNA